jgi:aerobic carbon-monoxide dehydrogenase large subunit
MTGHMRPAAGANTLVGQPIERTEDVRFLLGTGQFADDYEPNGVLHAAIFRSSVAHGRIVALDVSRAMVLKGVRGIVTARDIGPTVPRIPLRLAPIPGFEKYLQPVIAAEKVRYVGEPVAVVVADSRAIAEDALELIDLQIAPLAPVADWKVSECDASLLFEENGTNVPVRYTAGLGDADEAFKAADYVRKETFRAHRHTANPMETRGLAAEWDGAAGRLKVTAATKVNYHNRRLLARMMGLQPGDIDMIEIDVGGGFGVRGEFYPEDFLIPFAARHLGRPVKWIEDRREHLLAANHSREIDCELSIACRVDGTILAMRGAIYGDMGAYIRTNGGVVPAKAAQFLHGPYRIRNFKIEVSTFVTTKTPVGTYRAPGRFEANFFRERLFDIAARDLGIDPVAFRRKNLITESEMPYAIGHLVPYETPTEFDTGDYPAALDACLERFGWKEKLELQGRVVNGRHQGLAVTCFVESGGAGPRENAKLTLEADGVVTIDVGSSALGQGLETVFGQIAGDALGLPMETFRVRHGSTTLLEEGFGTYHSRALVMGGSAILDAANKFIGVACSAAASYWKLPPDKISYAQGRFGEPDGRTLPLADLAKSVGPISANGSFANTKRTYSYGAHAAHVAVDNKTGHVEVVDYLAIEDVGRAVNPGIVHGQAIGAVVQGLGGVFLDHLIYDSEGQLLNGSFADYLLPIATDFPNVRGLTLELRPSPSNPLGAKGAGEGGIVAVAATVGNAVAAALAEFDVQPNELPLTPPRIWRLIKEAKARQASLTSRKV